MKKLLFCLILLVFTVSCVTNSTIEKEIEKIAVTVNVDRFDKAFANTAPQDLAQLKNTYPYLFSKGVNDSIWIGRIKDTLQKQLSEAVGKQFYNFSAVEKGLHSLFQHLKYYDPSFRVPKVVTVTDYVKYRSKTIVTDSIVLIALDTYLGSDHEFYQDIPKYIAQNMKPSQILPDVAQGYAEQYNFQMQHKTLLDEMLYYGKCLYFKDIMLPSVSEADKIGYTQAQLEWAKANEDQIWRYLISKELLYSTDSSLPARFTAPAPFTKFYLELDNQSPGRLGQFIGWQIVRAYMNHNQVSLFEMLKTPPAALFNQAKYKPNR